MWYKAKNFEGQRQVQMSRSTAGAGRGQISRVLQASRNNEVWNRSARDSRSLIAAADSNFKQPHSITGTAFTFSPRARASFAVKVLLS